MRFNNMAYLPLNSGRQLIIELLLQKIIKIILFYGTNNYTRKTNS